MDKCPMCRSKIFAGILICQKVVQQEQWILCAQSYMENSKKKMISDLTKVRQHIEKQERIPKNIIIDNRMFEPANFVLKKLSEENYISWEKKSDNDCIEEKLGLTTEPYKLLTENEWRRIFEFTTGLRVMPSAQNNDNQLFKAVNELLKNMSQYFHWPNTIDLDEFNSLSSVANVEMESPPVPSPPLAPSTPPLPPLIQHSTPVSHYNFQSWRNRT